MHQLPLIINSDTANEFFEKSTLLNFCKGTDYFTDLIKEKLEFNHFQSPNEETVGINESSKQGAFEETFTTIRHRDCIKLTVDEKRGRCESCKQYRNSLFAIRHRQQTSPAKRLEKTFVLYTFPRQVRST